MLDLDIDDVLGLCWTKTMTWWVGREFDDGLGQWIVFMDWTWIPDFVRIYYDLARARIA